MDSLVLGGILGLLLALAAPGCRKGRKVGFEIEPVPTVSAQARKKSARGKVAQAAGSSLRIRATHSDLIDFESKAPPGSRHECAFGDEALPPEDASWSACESKKTRLSEITGWSALADGTHSLLVRIVGFEGIAGVLEISKVNLPPDIDLAGLTLPLSESGRLVLGKTFKPQLPATDSDGDEVSITSEWAMERPAGSGLFESLALDENGAVTFTGSVHGGASLRLRIVVTDAHGASATLEKVFLAHENVSPGSVLGAVPPPLVEGVPLAFRLPVADPDDTGLQYRCVSDCPTGIAVGTDGVVTWTPTPGQAGAHLPVFEISDGRAVFRYPLALTVALGERTPELMALAAQSVPEGSPLSFPLLGTDANGDSLVYRCASGCPGGLAVDASTGAVSWTPSHMQAGAFMPTFEASDGRTAASLTVHITVTNVPLAPLPVAALSPANPTRATPLACSSAGSAAPDGGTLTFSYAWSVNGTTLAQTGSGLGPTHFARGDTVACRITADDGISSASADSPPVTIANTAPVLAAPATGSLQEGTPWALALEGTDLDEDALAFACETPCPAGLAVDPLTGEIAWTPTYAQAGSHAVAFRVSDDAASATLGLTLTVADRDTTPAMDAIAAKVVAEGAPLAFLVVASDADGDALSYSCVTGCPAGLTVDASTGAVSWTPTYAQAQAASVTFAATDGVHLVSRTVSISVLDTDTTPSLAAVPNASVYEGDLLSFTLDASDVDGDTLSYRCAAGCPVGLAVDANAGTVSWTPSNAQAGTHAPVFEATDGRNPTTRTPTFTVLDVAFPPSIVITAPAGGNDYATRSTSQTLSGTCTQTTLTLSADRPGTFTNACAANGTFTFAFTVGASGNVTLTATRPSGDSSTDAIAWTYDATPPSLAITSPTGTGVLTSDATLETLSGTCSAEALTLSVSPVRAFVDSDCTDGTWSLGAVAVPWTPTTYTVTATDAAGNAATSALALRKTVAVGQASITAEPQPADQLTGPWGVWTDGTRMAVADTYGNRVLLWNSMPSTGTAPSAILGQANRYGTDENSGGLGAGSLSGPSAVHFDGARLYVVDTGNNRVLIWNGFPSQTNRAADLVLGQPNFTSKAVNNGGIGASTLNTPYSIWSNGTRIFVADTGNHRVLIWNAIPTSSGTPASLALGQTSLTANGVNLGGISASTLVNPAGVSSDGSKLVVADRSNQRVLIWNTLPTTTGAAASVVLGQANMTSANLTSSATSSSRVTPLFVHMAAGRLSVSDETRNRVLVWTSIPTANATGPNLVLGQPNFDANLPNANGAAASSLHRPVGIASDATRLYVAEGNSRVLGFPLASLATNASADWHLGKDSATMVTAIHGLKRTFVPYDVLKVGTKVIVSDCPSNRVLIWNTGPAHPTAPPDVVLGQPDIQATTTNNGGLSARSLSCPVGLASDGTRLVVVDQGNHRVLVWSTIPTAHFASSNLVLGQADFTSNTVNRGGTVAASSLNAPSFAFTDGTRLYVSDHGNHRVLGWSAFPTVSGTAAAFALGQPSITNAACNAGGSVTGATLCGPLGIHSDGTSLYVADFHNHRILKWNAHPTVTGTAANIALGQSGLTSGAPNAGGAVTAQSLFNPIMVRGQGTKIVVADSNNYRILMWSATPTSNGQAASLVVGQPNFVTSTFNNDPGGVGRQMISYAHSVFLSGGELYVADHSSQRLLVWNRIPTANHEPADMLLNGWLAVPLRLAPNAQRLGARHAVVIGSRLVVADTTHHRVLIYNSVPTTSGASADVVLGQSSMAGSTPNALAAAPHIANGRSLYSPRAVATDGTRLIVADQGNNRVLIWNTVPTDNTRAADVVLGQADLVSNAPNRAGVGASTLFLPAHVSTDGGKLFVTDFGNHRVLVWNSIPAVSGTPADVVIGQANFSAQRANQGGSAGAATLFRPSSAEASDGDLAITDQGNNRVLLYAGVPTSNGSSADRVVGQPDSTSTACDNGGLSARSLCAPVSALFARGKLVVSDSATLRVLVWNAIPSTSFAPASSVLGQPDFLTRGIGSVGANVVGDAQYLSASEESLLVPSLTLKRILLLPLP